MKVGSSVAAVITTLCVCDAAAFVYPTKSYDCREKHVSEYVATKTKFCSRQTRSHSTPPLSPYETTDASATDNVGASHVGPVDVVAHDNDDNGVFAVGDILQHDPGNEADPKAASSAQQTSDPVRAEQIARSLLAARLQLELSARNRAALSSSSATTKVTIDVGPKAPPKVAPNHPKPDPIRAETIARSLLATRLKLEAVARALSSEKATFVINVGPIAPRKVRREYPEADPIRAEQVVRSLLNTRLNIEKSIRDRAKQQALWEAEKRAQESKQRAILTDRLHREKRIREAVRAEQERVAAQQQALLEARLQPKAPEEEATLAAKYGAIHDIGERKFQILLDLGMVEQAPDPNSPDYDSSRDDDYVDGMRYVG